MSASLVGSEMCIRDRFAQTPNLLMERAGGCANSGAESTPPELQGPVSVSYTHLTLPTICSV
eukprot:10167917-Alexandrium_andersonii.AAC.1